MSLALLPLVSCLLALAETALALVLAPAIMDLLSSRPCLHRLSSQLLLALALVPDLALDLARDLAPDQAQAQERARVQALVLGQEQIQERAQEQVQAQALVPRRLRRPLLSQSATSRRQFTASAPQ